MQRLLAALRRRAAGHTRIFRFLHSLTLHEQAAVVMAPANETVLVLAPHMDDEVLGCGATLAAHADAGADITAVYLTDGRYGAGPGTGAQADLTATRRAEATRAAAVLGIRQQHFIDGTGNRLGEDAAAAAALRAVLERARPAVVYLPGFLERHPDHRATGDVLATAVSGTSLNFECRSYEVWTPLMPNQIVPIDAMLARKRAALHCYASQLAHNDFEHFAIALNAYRSSLVGGGKCRHAEAFFAAPLRDYLKLHRAFRASCAP